MVWSVWYSHHVENRGELTWKGSRWGGARKPSSRTHKTMVLCGRLSEWIAYWHGMEGSRQPSKLKSNDKTPRAGSAGTPAQLRSIFPSDRKRIVDEPRVDDDLLLSVEWREERISFVYCPGGMDYRKGAVTLNWSHARIDFLSQNLLGILFTSGGKYILCLLIISVRSV